MDEITNAELALLSLIAEKPCHAYEIEKLIQDRNIRDWTDLGFSSIYRLLTKLEKQGLLEGEMTPPEGRGPARKVYHLTELGKVSWKKSTLNNLADPDRKYSSFLIALDNLGSLPKSEALQALSSNLKDQIAINEHLSKSIKNHPLIDDFYIRSFFDYLLHIQESEITWLKTFINKYKNHTNEK